MTAHLDLGAIHPFAFGFAMHSTPLTAATSAAPASGTSICGWCRTESTDDAGGILRRRFRTSYRRYGSRV